MQDFHNLVKLSQSFDVIHTLGGAVEPQDVPVHLRHYETTRSMLLLSDNKLQEGPVTYRANLRLAMSVFLDGHVRDAQKLLEEKARFRDLEREYAANHIARLQDNTAQSIETSSLHLDLISELKRINSHICSIAYPILEEAGVLAKTRLMDAAPAAEPTHRRDADDDWGERDARSA